ncbi:hypothetical protein [Flammeovirga aprica]|uniref:Uncharacterized protein n=1 Tax=Flammeovirga aprica JL-4 TaxID=694437 RepID=A0A7X9RYP9_9BACT|nr:hypothetical protein [Flammeovirga aprica]NME71077.1 hypothetical protein [Flammeovirga aprica JL-4]
MGFNIAGIVINKNYNGKLDELKEDLGYDFSNAQEITFEAASSNWKEEGICDAYLGEHGTILFLNHESCIDAHSVEGANVLTFALSEVSMAFIFFYYEGDQLVRSFSAFNGEKEAEEGAPLPSEKGADELDSTFNQIKEVIGESFWDIDMSAKSLRIEF